MQSKDGINAPLEVLEHGTLKRAAFADDLSYCLYLGERAAQEQAQPTDLSGIDSIGFQGRVIAAASELMTIGDGEEWRSFIVHIEAWARALAAQPQAAIQAPAGDDDHCLKMMCLVEDYMAAVDWHGSQNGEKCDAAIEAIGQYLRALAAPAIPPAAMPAQASGMDDAVTYEADEGTVAARRDGEIVWHTHIYCNNGNDELEIAKQVAAMLAASTTPPAPAPAIQAQPLTDAAIFRIRDTIKPGDGWDGDNWDLALGHAIAKHLAGDTPAEGT